MGLAPSPDWLQDLPSVEAACCWWVAVLSPSAAACGIWVGLGAAGLLVGGVKVLGQLAKGLGVGTVHSWYSPTGG